MPEEENKKEDGTSVQSKMGLTSSDPVEISPASPGLVRWPREQALEEHEFLPLFFHPKGTKNSRALYSLAADMVAINELAKKEKTSAVDGLEPLTFTRVRLQKKTN